MPWLDAGDRAERRLGELRKTMTENGQHAVRRCIPHI
jgi:hypothetical protein